MPQSGRGGKRVGRPGAQYQNRSDMQQSPRAVPGQPYGVAGQQVAAQQQMPLPQTPAPAGGASPEPTATLPGLTDPTARPQEPLTHGLPTGPGAGPEAIGVPVGPVDPTINLIKGMLAAYPNPDLQALLAQANG